MKKLLSIILVISLSVVAFVGCGKEFPITTATPEANEENIVYPLPETLDITKLDNCTVAALLKKGDVFVNDDGKMVMNLTVYTYELYDMVDIAALSENDIIIHHNEKVKVTKLERMDTGLVRINDGEENGGFDLISKDSTVYYEIGMNDIKSYYELGKVTLPVSDEFEYIDESDLLKEAKIYYPQDFLAKDTDIEYNFSPNNTNIVIENGCVKKMNKIYIP